MTIETVGSFREGAMRLAAILCLVVVTAANAEWNFGVVDREKTAPELDRRISLRPTTELTHQKTQQRALLWVRGSVIAIEADDLDRAIVFDRQDNRWEHLDGTVWRPKPEEKIVNDSKKNSQTKQKSTDNYQDSGGYVAASVPRDSDAGGSVGPVDYATYGHLGRWTWPRDLRQHLKGAPHHLDAEWCDTATPRELVEAHDRWHERNRGRSVGRLRVFRRPFRRR